MIVFGEPHLRRTLTEFAVYYNRVRTHRSLDVACVRRETKYVSTRLAWERLDPAHKMTDNEKTIPHDGESHAQI
jgi:hypothetical protein